MCVYVCANIYVAQTVVLKKLGKERLITGAVKKKKDVMKGRSQLKLEG